LEDVPEGAQHVNGAHDHTPKREDDGRAGCYRSGTRTWW
jgi:hypothetical protein